MSKLALVVRQQNNDAHFGGFVLDAASGEPIAGAEVQGYAWDWNGGCHHRRKAKTDRNGLFSAEGLIGKNNLLYVTHAGQELATANNLNVNANNNRPIPQNR